MPFVIRRLGHRSRSVLRPILGNCSSAWLIVVLAFLRRSSSAFSTSSIVCERSSAIPVVQGWGLPCAGGWSRPMVGASGQKIAKGVARCFVSRFPWRVRRDNSMSKDGVRILVVDQARCHEVSVANDKQQRQEGRPDPEELLKRYGLRDSDLAASTSTTPAGTDNQQQKRRGRLRVYLGAAAGVGKTYAMLNEGRRRKARGTDVVVGYV